MNKYLVIVKLGSQRVKTAVYAENPVHARLLVQYAYGMDSVGSTPVPISKGDDAHPLYDNITPKPPSIKPKSPPTPQQAQVAGLKQKVAQDKLKLNQVQAQQRQQRDAQRLTKQRQSIAQTPH
jgi:hypothetical protein